MPLWFNFSSTFKKSADMSWEEPSPPPSIEIGIGEVVTHSPLPHDRTCGSASGGSAGRTNQEP